MSHRVASIWSLSVSYTHLDVYKRQPLKDDSATLAAICEQYGTPCKYEVFEGTIHAFLHYTRVLDDANDALEHGASFFREVCGMGLRGIN